MQTSGMDSSKFFMHYDLQNLCMYISGSSWYRHWEPLNTKIHLLIFRQTSRMHIYCVRGQQINHFFIQLMPTT